METSSLAHTDDTQLERRRNKSAIANLQTDPDFNPIRHWGGKMTGPATHGLSLCRNMNLVSKRRLLQKFCCKAGWDSNELRKARLLNRMRQASPAGLSRPFGEVADSSSFRVEHLANNLFS
jgi:hypothetical protein